MSTKIAWTDYPLSPTGWLWETGRGPLFDLATVHYGTRRRRAPWCGARSDGYLLRVTDRVDDVNCEQCRKKIKPHVEEYPI